MKTSSSNTPKTTPCSEAGEKNGKCLGLPIHSCRYCSSYIHQENYEYEDYEDYPEDTP